MLVEVLCGIVILSILFRIWAKKKLSLWANLGVPEMERKWPWKDDVLMKRVHFNEAFYKQSLAFKDSSYCGGYFLFQPQLLVHDVDLIKHILVKDFDNFVDRQPPTFSKIFRTGTFSDKIWMKQMTNLEGEEWKEIRSTFTPIFTSGRMKAMIIFMQNTCNQLMQCMDKCADKKEDFELKEILGKYSMETLASCAFGVDAQSFSTENSQFVANAKSMFDNTIYDILKFVLAMIPGGKILLRGLDVSISPSKNVKFFYEVVTSTLKHRKETSERRNDLIDMMLDAIKGDLQYSNQEDEEQFEKDAKFKHHSSKKNVDELAVVATAIVILVAGYDTTGSTLAFALYELSKNQNVQEKIREELNEITNGDNEKEFTYEDLKSLNYLDQVICETLRLHTPLGFLGRNAINDYKIPGTDIVIPKGTQVIANVIGVHFNEEYYPNPFSFNPDNFSKEAKANRSQYTYLPFGQGPRGCIGMRFALLEIKLALANIIRRYNLIPSSKTVEPIQIDPQGILAYAKDGIYMKVEKRG